MLVTSQITSNRNTHTHIDTHLVEKRDRGLQDLLPLAELSLVKLPLKLQDLSPLSSRLGQRTEKRRRRGGVKMGEDDDKRSEEVWGENLVFHKVIKCV